MSKTYKEGDCVTLLVTRKDAEGYIIGDQYFNAQVGNIPAGMSTDGKYMTFKLGFRTVVTKECFNFDDENVTVVKELGEYVPFDMYGRPIEIGMLVAYPLGKGGAGSGACLRFGTVTKIHKPTHRGYGYWTRKLTFKDYHNKQVSQVHNYPANCIIDTFGLAEKVGTQQ